MANVHRPGRRAAYVRSAWTTWGAGRASWRPVPRRVWHDASLIEKIRFIRPVRLGTVDVLRVHVDHAVLRTTLRTERAGVPLVGPTYVGEAAAVLDRTGHPPLPFPNDDDDRTQERSAAATGRRSRRCCSCCRRTCSEDGAAEETGEFRPQQQIIEIGRPEALPLYFFPRPRRYLMVGITFIWWPRAVTAADVLSLLVLSCFEGS